MTVRTIHLCPDVVLFHGDMLNVLDSLPPDSIDAVCCDPPYHLTSVVERFGKPGSAPALSNGATGVYGRSSKGFLGQEWDGGDIAFRVETWRKVLRVLKPGGHCAAFGAPKNFGRLQVAILDAGFEERDTLLHMVDPDDAVVQFLESLNAAQLAQFFRALDNSDASGMLAWNFGSGFPKSQNVARFIDDHHFAEWLDADQARRAGYKSDMRVAGMVAHEPTRRAAERATLKRWRERAGLPFEFGDPKSAAHAGWIDRGRMRAEGAGAVTDGFQRPWQEDETAVDQAARRYLPQSAEAREFEGWGTALKPAFEPIVLARKPLSEGTVAANVVRWRTGAMNVDACRVGTDVLPAMRAGQAQLGTFERHDMVTPEREGRWPANITHDGSAAVLERFPESKGQQVAARCDGEAKKHTVYGTMHHAPRFTVPRGDSGSAARFFFNSSETDLQWLARNLPKERANDAAKCSHLDVNLAVSVLSSAVAQSTPLSAPICSACPEHFMSVTPNELRKISDAVIETILSLSGKCSRESLPEKRSLSNSLVNVAVIRDRTDTIAITVSRSKSNGCAEPATFRATLQNSEHGAADCASRFHYSSKANKADRAGSKHPTVKPIALMRWLCDLLTPPGGVVLDPFAGSGTTLAAAVAGGFKAIGVEREDEYVADIQKRFVGL